MNYDVERSLVIVKPDGVQRGLVGEIMSRFERPGFKIIGMKMLHPSPELAGEHYADDQEWLKSVGEKAIKSFEEKGCPTDEDAMTIGNRVRQHLMQYISMSPVVAFVIEGHGAIDKIRAIVGATAPAAAAPGTIRGDLAFDTYGLSDSSGRPIQNLIHASGTVDEAKREIALWFKEEDLFPYQRVDEALLYRKVE